MDEDKVIFKILKLEEDVNEIKETMATKKDHQEVMNALDRLIKLSEKKDQELTFMGSRITRAEDDIKKIKPLVGLSTT